MFTEVKIHDSISCVDEYFQANFQTNRFYRSFRALKSRKMILPSSYFQSYSSKIILCFTSNVTEVLLIKGDFVVWSLLKRLDPMGPTVCFEFPTQWRERHTECITSHAQIPSWRNGEGIATLPYSPEESFFLYPFLPVSFWQARVLSDKLLTKGGGSVLIFTIEIL